MARKIRLTSFGGGVSTGIAEGIANGVSNFINAYQGTQMRNLQIQAYKENQDLRRAQIQAKMAEAAPQLIDLQKIQVAKRALDLGLIPEKSFSDRVNGAIDRADTPAKIDLLKRAAESYGGEGFGTDLPKIDEVSPQSESGPSSSGDSQSGNAVVSMNKAERDIFAKIMQGQNAANIAQISGGYRLDAAQLSANAALDRVQAEIDGKLQTMKLDGEQKKELQGLKNQLERFKAETSAGARVKSAEISANARITTQKLKGHGSKSNPEVTATLNTIKQLEKQRGDVGKNPGLIPLNDTQKNAARSDIDSRLQIQYNRYRQLTGKDYLSGPSAAPAAPAAPAASPAGPKIHSFDDFKAGSLSPGDLFFSPDGATKYQVQQSGKALPVQ